MVTMSWHAFTHTILNAKPYLYEPSKTKTHWTIGRFLIMQHFRVEPPDLIRLKDLRSAASMMLRNLFAMLTKHPSSWSSVLLLFCVLSTTCYEFAPQ